MLQAVMSFLVGQLKKSSLNGMGLEKQAESGLTRKGLGRPQLVEDARTLHARVCERTVWARKDICRGRCTWDASLLEGVINAATYCMGAVEHCDI